MQGKKVAPQILQPDDFSVSFSLYLYIGCDSTRLSQAAPVHPGHQLFSGLLAKLR
jgi:hypothetical protein